MRYVSTRGQAPVRDFSGVLLAGLAEDGGLYVPETWPRLSPRRLARAARPALCGAGGAGDRSLSSATASRSRRCRRFAATPMPGSATPPSVPLVQLDTRSVRAGAVPRPDAGLQGHGDAAARAAVRSCAGEQDARVTIVGATSGDTGSAAIEALRRARRGSDIVILHPDGRTSEVQRRQMTTVTARPTSPTSRSTATSTIARIW